jgi:hypothetical protein
LKDFPKLLRCATGETVKKSHISNNQNIKNCHILQTATKSQQLAKLSKQSKGTFPGSKLRDHLT